jgi:hypothetical protein
MRGGALFPSDWRPSHPGPALQRLGAHRDSSGTGQLATSSKNGALRLSRHQIDSAAFREATQRNMLLLLTRQVRRSRLETNSISSYDRKHKMRFAS